MADHRFVEQVVICPHCSGVVEIAIEVSTRAQVPFEPNDFNQRWLATLDASQQAFLEHAKASGTLAAYQQVMQMAGPVKSEFAAMRSLLTFFARSVRRPLSIDVAEVLRDAFDIRGRDIYALLFAAIVGIVVDGRVIAFYPIGAAIGVGQGKNAKAKDRRPPDIGQLQELVRTKYGYVPRGSMLADEMRRRSVGEFADVSLA